MKVITGHLTPTNKKAIKAILALGLDEGKVGRIVYIITNDKDIYTVKVKQKDRGLMPVGGSPLRVSTYTSTFTI